MQATDISEPDAPTSEQKQKKSFKYYALKWLHILGINPLSFILNLILWIVIGGFLIFLDNNIRDFLTKNYALPLLQEFNIPQIKYNQLVVDDNNTIKGSDIIVHDDIDKKFLKINDISIKPKTILDINQGIKNITISDMVLYKNPVFASQPKEKPTSKIIIPDVPLDIETLKIKKLTLKPAITGLKQDLNLKIWAKASTDNTANAKVTFLDIKIVRLH